MKNRAKIIFTLSIVILCTSICLASYAVEGMIIRFHENGNPVINKGFSDNLRPDVILYVTRMGEPVGTITIAEVDDYNSSCTITELMDGQHLQVGDLFSTTPFEKPEDKPAPETPGSDNTSPTDEKLEKEKMEARKEYEKNVTKQYEDAVKRKTQIYSFKRGSGGTVKIDAFDVYNLFTPMILTPYPSFNVWHGASTAYGIYSSYKSSANPSKIRNVQIEVTLWDTEYLDAFSAYYAFKETVRDPRQISEMKNNINKQKGLDQFYVFQVKIINPGPGTIQFAPFPWHFYLIGSDGSKIKSDHYDEILDKALSENQVVNGYIYFKRYGPGGEPVLKGNDVNIELADIIGNNKTITFK